MAPVPSNVTIIGAGLAGLSLALALHDKNIHATIYELRESSYNMGGAIMLSPNALRVLDNIGKPKSVYQRVRHQGYNFDKLSFVNEDHELTSTYYFGHKELYGYHGLRIYRQILIKELIAMCEERHIPIHYGQRYFRIVSEDCNAVAIAMEDGKEIETNFLIGADGINSSVRKYLSDVSPRFGGLLGITTAIPTSALRLPPSYPLPVTIQTKIGAFVMAPQNEDGSEMFIGRQRPYPALPREGWTALREDKAKLHEMFVADKSDWNDVVQSAMEAVEPANMNIWPFHLIPKVETWRSEYGRVVLVGDAAHAIPPSAGQGVNQAFEDSFTLAFLMASLGEKGVELGRALEFWQGWREERLVKVGVLTQQMNNKRLPQAERVKCEDPDGGEGELAWLYAPDLKEEMAAWVRQQASAE